MKILSVLLVILSVLLSTVAHAESEGGRRSRDRRAMPGPQSDMYPICDRILNQDPLDDARGYSGYSDEDDRGRDEVGPDEGYDGI